MHLGLKISLKTCQKTESLYWKMTQNQLEMSTLQGLIKPRVGPGPDIHLSPHSKI